MGERFLAGEAGHVQNPDEVLTLCTRSSSPTRAPHLFSHRWWMDVAGNDG